MPRAQYVGSWWAQRWIAVLDALGPEYASRLTRGRSLARDGSVSQVVITAGAAEAQVRGSYWETYTVRLELRTFSDAEWQRAIDALASEALGVARLLAGELPPQVEQLFAQVGVKLFPDESNDLRSGCTCADPIVPCKHTLGLHFALATRLDTNPFLLLQLRGRSREVITQAVRARWSTELNPAEQAASAAQVGAPEDDERALHVAHFYEASAPLDGVPAPTFPAVPQTAGEILLRLGRPAFASEYEDPRPLLTQVYQAVSERASFADRRSSQRRPSGAAEGDAKPGTTQSDNAGR